MVQSVRVRVGDQLFDREDGEAFGAVVEVHAHELLVNIEGHGQLLLPAASVRAVHDGKIIINTSTLSSEIQQRIAHAHDRETDYR